jgi:type III pantothenate kinase
MLLAFDIGNTQITMGLFCGEHFVAKWRLSTRPDKSSAELWVSLGGLFREAGLDPADVNTVCIASVVPAMEETLREMCLQHLGLHPIVVEPGLNTRMPILYDDPSRIGADRIVNSIAGAAVYGCPLIVVDSGTATKFEAVSADSRYLGGAIFPGIGISAESLWLNAAMLPKVDFSPPPNTIARDTSSSIQSGLIFGYAAMVDGMVRRIKKEMGGDPRVIATGGSAEIIARHSAEIDEVNPLLTLIGLRIVAEAAQSNGSAVCADA